MIAALIDTALGKPTSAKMEPAPLVWAGTFSFKLIVGQLKAALVVQLRLLMAEREITQTAASKMVEMKQPALSKPLSGQFKLVSVEKLMRMLTAFDQDVEITVKPHRKRGEAGRIACIPAA